MIDIQTGLLILTSVISGASMILKVIAPLTKTKKDDNVLKFLNKVLSFLSLNVKTQGKEVVVKVKSR